MQKLLFEIFGYWKNTILFLGQITHTHDKRCKVMPIDMQCVLAKNALPIASVEPRLFFLVSE